MQRKIIYEERKGISKIWSRGFKVQIGKFSEDFRIIENWGFCSYKLFYNNESKIDGKRTRNISKGL